MKNKLIILITINIFIFGCSTQEEQIAKLEDKIHFLKEELVPIRFKILEKDSLSIKFLLKFYEQDAKEAFLSDTLMLEGQELSFDFYIVPVKDAKNDKEVRIAFPYRIFTNKIPAKKGIMLFNYYDEHGFPQVFNSVEADTSYVNRMTELFIKIKEGDIEDIDGIFGNMVQDIKDFNEFAENHIYKIVIHSKGGIEIRENLE